MTARGYYGVLDGDNMRDLIDITEIVEMPWICPQVRHQTRISGI